MPNAYELMSNAELDAAIVALEDETERLRALDLKLDMARGKPSPEQIALSRPMLDLIDSTTPLDDGGLPVGNYGAPDGLPSARALAAQIMGVDPANVVVNGSSSLNLMHDLVCHAYTHGIGGNKPWCQQRKVKFLCPSPGYDRHFRVSAHYGIENVPVPMHEDGPDMETIVRLVEADPAVKGVWCVPKFANPTGITYSDEVVRQFANIHPAAPDFRIFWDNAYAVHAFTDEDVQLLNIFDALAEAGQSDLVYEFGSTAKVTFPSSGMAYVTASSADMAEIRGAFSVMRVSPEKFSQLAHVLFLRDLDGVKAHMKRHAAVVGPRFALVEQKLTEGLGALQCATWTHPKGGYFISFDGPEGSAKAIVKLAADLGVKMTPAGATWPYGNDPHDTNIRIAPTYPSLEELGRALDVFVVAVSLVSARLAKSARA